ncbi:MAG: hypothetical protein DSY55_01570 [Clostridia bacterium]|nr:MAG: hypothetical protein DSY55_01570 [Clostridia bacterium]
MISIQRQIANLNVTVQGQPSRFMAQLERELSVYPPARQQPDILIQFGPRDDGIILAKNPAIHREYEDGFAAQFGQSIVRWHWGQSHVQVDWSLASREQNWRQKIRNMQYTHPYEQIGQAFFELVLIPTLQLFYHNNLLLLHGSALSDDVDNHAIVFGGTGGIGKTSLELSLAGNGYKFMADDISILDAEGDLHANFAWPKIYGYNTFEDTKTKEKIFQFRGPADRFFWELRMRRFGGSRVRRRIDPQRFFGGAINQHAPLKTYYILFREFCNEMNISAIHAEKAIDLSLNIMLSEYTILYQHLYWHQANRIGLGLEPFITIDAIFESWRRLGIHLFSDIQCYLVHVPMNTSAASLRASLTPLVQQK